MDNINNIIKREIVPGTTTEIHGLNKTTILWIELLTDFEGHQDYKTIKKIIYKEPIPPIDINSPSTIEINKSN